MRRGGKSDCGQNNVVIAREQEPNGHTNSGTARMAGPPSLTLRATMEAGPPSLTLRATMGADRGSRNGSATGYDRWLEQGP